MAGKHGGLSPRDGAARGRRLNVELLEDRRLLAVAGPFELLKDINATLESGGSSPTSLTAIDGAMYFSAYVPFLGEELWKSDGTAAGTALLKDINQGHRTTSSSYPREFTKAGNTIFFKALDDEYGFELWKTDGTSHGTVRVKDISASIGWGVSDSSSELTAVGNVLYFLARDAETKFTLWKSDGTVEGTVLVKDVEARNLTNVNGMLYFSASDGVNGVELWKSDGTAGGTVLVKDIRSGIASSTPTLLTNINGALYFQANDGIHGFELWKSDETLGGTTLVKDLNPGPAGSGLSNILAYKSELYFVADDGQTSRALWKSNGSADATELVKSIRVGSFTSSISNLTNVGGALFFSASRAGIVERELWTSDGTANGTILIKSGLGSFSRFTNIGPTLYFTASDGVSGIELWKSDGTTDGTSLVRDVRAGAGSAFATTEDVGRELIAVDARLFFSATDGLRGRELWMSDGTESGTALLKDVRGGTGGGLSGSTLVVGDRVFFHANDGTTGIELWTTDGTPQGTLLVKDILEGAPSSYPSGFSKRGAEIYFSVTDDANGFTLWKSDGTADGTVPAEPGGTPVSYIEAGGTRYFLSNDGVHGLELWKVNDAGPATLVKDIRPGAEGSPPLALTEINGLLLFVANDGVSGSELWRSDGTTSGTVLVKDIRVGPYGFLDLGLRINLTSIGGVVYFTANDGTSGSELWRTDGTSQGTVPVRDIGTGAASSNPKALTNVNSTLFFTAEGGQGQRALWKSDGTAAGTVLVKEFFQLDKFVFTSLTNVGGTLYFAADDGLTGRELWRSDGTPAGTVLAFDFQRGGVGSFPFAINQLGDQLLVGSQTEEFGSEFWVANLTPDVLGDFDVDGDVDGADILKWQRQVGGATSPAGSRADADGSGAVGGGDLALWKVNFGAGGATVANAGVEIAQLAPGESPGAKYQVAADAVYAAGDFTQLFAGARSYRPARRERGLR